MFIVQATGVNITKLFVATDDDEKVCPWQVFSGLSITFWSKADACLSGPPYSTFNLRMGQIS
jgi:hypothetical protein